MQHTHTTGKKAAQQPTELCYYPSSVSSPTHTSAMCYSTQTANSLRQYDAERASVLYFTTSLEEGQTGTFKDMAISSEIRRGWGF